MKLKNNNLRISDILLRENTQCFTISPELKKQLKGTNVPNFKRENLNKIPEVRKFLAGEISCGQARVSKGGSKEPLRAPELAVFYLLTKNRENIIRDWKEFLALPEETIRNTKVKFRKVMVSDDDTTAKTNSTPVYNLAIGIFNALPEDQVVDIAEKNFTEENRELTQKIRQDDEVKKGLTAKKQSEKNKKTLHQIAQDYVDLKKNPFFKKKDNDRALVAKLAKDHNIGTDVAIKMLKQKNIKPKL